MLAFTEEYKTCGYAIMELHIRTFLLYHITIITYLHNCKIQ